MLLYFNQSCLEGREKSRKPTTLSRKPKYKVIKYVNIIITITSILHQQVVTYAVLKRILL